MATLTKDRGDAAQGHDDTPPPAPVLLVLRDAMKKVEAQVIIIGGGLAGLSAAHTVLENGGAVILLDKMKFLGCNSTRATSGINGVCRRTALASRAAAKWV